MSLFEFCIRRPVFATVLSLVLVLLGIVSYGRLTVREYPNVDEPVVSVSTSYPGASATIVESQITQVLEGSIAGIAGIDVLESTSRAETSRITIRFLSELTRMWPPATCATASAACAAACRSRCRSPPSPRSRRMRRRF
jgi:multidrug efflux pump